MPGDQLSGFAQGLFQFVFTIWEYLVSGLPIIALLISLIILATAIYIYRKRPIVVAGSVGGLEFGVKVATDFFVRPRSGERKPAKAYLIPMTGSDASRQEPIPLRGETTRLGRDDSWANIVLQDSSISRLHAKIVEEQDGAFKIYDEGSRSGTFVNEEVVPISGQWLHEGDMIALGQDTFLFKLKLITKEPTELFERSSPQSSSKEETDVVIQPMKKSPEAISVFRDLNTSTLDFSMPARMVFTLVLSPKETGDFQKLLNGPIEVSGEVSFRNAPVVPPLESEK